MRARLVELDERNVALARQAAQAAGLPGVEVLQGDPGVGGCPCSSLRRAYWQLACFSVGLSRGMEQRIGALAARRPAEGNHMEANADRFLELLHQFEDFTDAISPERAQVEFDETTLQLFWMRWPQVSAWTGSLWRMLSEEMSGPSAPPADEELDEVGESG